MKASDMNDTITIFFMCASSLRIDWRSEKRSRETSWELLQ